MGSHRNSFRCLKIEVPIVKDVDGPAVPWVCIDPLDPDLQTFPQYANSSPIKVRLLLSSVLQIRFILIRILIQLWIWENTNSFKLFFSVVDPDWLYPDPDPQNFMNTDLDPGQ